jgi:hypothetical protein
MKPSNRPSARSLAGGAVLIPPERCAFWKMREIVIDFSRPGEVFFCPH